MTTAPNLLIVDDRPKSTWHLSANMLFPGDANGQHNYMQHREYRALIDRQKNGEIPRPAMGSRPARTAFESAHGDDVDALDESIAELNHQALLPPPRPEDVSRRITFGLLSGACIMYFRALDCGADLKTAAGHIAQPSLNIVTYICERHNLGRPPSPKGRPKSDSSSHLRRLTHKDVLTAWREYRNVAHIWAACFHLNDQRFEPEGTALWDDTRLLGNLGLINVLDIATNYGHFASRFFAGQRIGRIQRDRLEPLEARHIRQLSSHPWLDEPPALPPNVVATVEKYTREYRSQS